MPQNLKPGDRVQFNIGKEDGPIAFGMVARTWGKSVVVQPSKPIPGNAKFFNIKKLEESK